MPLPLIAVLLVVVLVAAGVVVIRGRGAGPGTEAGDGPDAAQGEPAAAAPAAADPDDPMGRVVEVLRRKTWARRSLSVLSVVLLLGAAAMVGFPYFSNLWQERVQSNLDRQFASADLEEAYRARDVGEGDALTRLLIPSLDVDVVVVEGITASALRAGAGHYPFTPLPCEVGNVAIAGHRTTYGRPFHNLDLLEHGETVILETPVGTCTYEIEVGPYEVTPNQTEVVDNTPDEAMLTLTTCHPKGSAAKRLIVHGTMVSSEFHDA